MGIKFKAYLQLLASKRMCRGAETATQGKHSQCMVTAVCGTGSISLLPYVPTWRTPRLGGYSREFWKGRDGSHKKVVCFPLEVVEVILRVSKF